MKILHINSYYNGSPFHKNLYDLQRKDNKVDVYAHMAVEDQNLIKDSDCIVGRPYKRYERVFYFIKHYKIMRDIKKRINLSDYDIVHAHTLFSNGYEAYKIYKKYNIPYVISIRDTDIYDFYKIFIHLRPLALKILLNAKEIVYISENYKNFHINNYVKAKYREQILKKAHVITIAADNFWLENTDSHTPSDNIRVIAAGVINSRKNQITTCRALQLLEAKGYNVSFEVYGKIIDKKIYDELIKFKFLRYHEPVPKEKLCTAFRQNDILVMPSVSECFGLAYVEAMSQGLPVIYTKGQGFESQFEDGFVGYSVDAFDYEKLADLILLCKEQYARLSKNCVETVQRYNWEIINQKFIELYEGLIIGEK